MSSSSLYHPRPVLSSQRYTPSPDYLQDARRTYHNNSRLPLREANSNAQSHNFNGMVSCYQSPVGISPSVPHSLPAPMVPSQSFDCLYRVPTPRNQPRGFQRRPRSGVNPLYFWPAFRQYRNRQAHKDTQKDKGGVWRRPELEDAFVDSVLLMPHMGRRKFSMGGKLHGRNMLISEYIFVICVAILGSKEIFRIDNSNDSIEQMGRKQVSSHMQVVKKFFEDLRCFHFLFPAEEKKEPGSTNSDDYYDEEEQESFKSNPVLTALAEGRVPDVKPNYEYFSQLLALQSLITVRPKTAEVYVSSSEVKIRDDIAYDSHDTPLDQESFPHLNKYSNCDDSPTVLGKDVLLHEYTRSLDRSTSACVKTVTRRWQKDAPEIYETLDLPTRDEECLLLEMCATLELHDHARFPSGSELTGFVEVAITQPNLQNHRWKCVTRLTRPAELHGDDKKQGVYTNETGIHRRGCGDSKPDCDCHSRPRQDIHVPFPAVEWASILSQAVQYPDVEHQRKKEKRSKGDGDRKKHDLDRAGSKRKRSEDDGDAASWARRELTGSDLICKVAMYQELWSCAPDSTRWVRQGIIFWRFNTTNQWYKYNPVFKPAGTSWRWLTVNDPMSRYHQQKALVYPSATVSRDSIMSPTPSINQHMTAAMNETFSSAWDSNVSLAQVPTVPAANNGLTLFESFSNGLATPPPTAGLQGSYPASFDHGMPPSTGVGFLPSTCSTAGESQSVGGHAQSQSYYDVQTTLADLKPAMSAVNPFQGPTATTGLDLSNPLVYDNSECDGLQGWDMPTLDGWSTGTGAGSDWSSQGAKVEPSSDQASLWTQSQWTQMGADRDGSPRPMKRRRGDTIEGHVPVTMAAGAW
ncbi:Conidiophore development regulator abaA [Fusarium keratoplasticum]|uniref:Conidiophore development regulator abaA n=1 Tax=Fusarium keratoplasticum TaxID=1328300 RepID=A0ACC0RFS1_9HYPO|nr:Conidiophore development regulator abaA [Fusarium keratoplasticum]KAI8684706.1 Conidiophore development regulator abaA [Fusarium keratoplasticum]KAI8688817.1 Conidiophore development regulator abaA [Fusarium keratoplasticum]